MSGAAAATAIGLVAIAGVPAGAATAAAAGSPAQARPTLPAPAKVPLADTDGQPATVLLANALQLLRVSMERPSLTKAISGDQARLEADVAAAHRAQAEASAANAHAAVTGAQAASAERAYESLSGTARAAALYLYLLSLGRSGGVALLPPSPATAGGNAAGGSDTAGRSEKEAPIGPNVVLGISSQLAAEQKAAVASLNAERQQAQAAYGQANQAVAAEKAPIASLRASLAKAPGVSSGNVAKDQLVVASQVGSEVTDPAALQFTPKTPLPAPLPTTSVALAWAFSELGKPYLWGGTGPDRFDCSGLTQYIWNKAGVQIPRVAADQYAWTVPVPLSQLLPGDLVFYGSTDIHHVGIYIGNGLMINAPHTGTVVQVSSIWWSDLAGFGRVHDAQVPVPARAVPTPAAPAVKAVVATAGPVPSQPGGSPARESSPAAWGTSPAAKSPAAKSPATKSAQKPATPATTTPAGAPAPTTTPTTAPATTTVPPTTTTPTTAPTTTTVPPTTTAPAETTTTVPDTTTTSGDPPGS